MEVKTNEGNQISRDGGDKYDGVKLRVDLISLVWKGEFRWGKSSESSLAGGVELFGIGLLYVAI